MKNKKNVSYFPVDGDEQDILHRLREPDLTGRAAELLQMLDLLGETKLSPADLEQAVRLLEASRQGEGLEARFENLEARLTARIERGLTEIEGRLSRRLGEAGPADSAPSRATPPSSSALPTATTTSKPAAPSHGPARPWSIEAVPTEANLAFQIEGELVWAPSAAQFYLAVWRWLFDHGRVSLRDLPIGTAGKKRYEVATQPVHPSGKEFYRAEQPTPGAFVEVNLSRGDIVRRAKKYLDQYAVTYAVVIGSEE